ncbi:hypothetical protein HLB44_22955 [Aquincola sp. S2]|uniref:DUF3761 domain-containing protein n=1 Tax=Pseudaquabacterium terrae TaxID=2732868 RepID=A0ABX2EMH4_9BURK|nr:hypothetical protein [Aquabacterium terrae]NRF69870.1 hypothetical protein [Aquabacterium terrae]
MGRRSLLLTGWMLALGASAAPQGSAPTSAECRTALEALGQLEARAIAARNAAAPGDDRVQRHTLDQVRALRRDAARACLGGSGDAPPPTASARPPLSVAPMVALPPSLRMPAAPTTPPTVITPRPSPPVVVTSCDPTGCWASDGSRLTRFGSNLLGPRGVCSTGGGILNCP